MGPDRLCDLRSPSVRSGLALVTAVLAGVVMGVVTTPAQARTQRAGVSAGVARVVSAGAARAEIAGAARVGQARSSQQLQLVLPLVADTAGLSRFATEVTTVGSPDYAQYESIAELSRRFGASARARRLVLRYLRRAGATHLRVDATGLFVDAVMRAGAAGRLFSTQLASFRTAHEARFTAPTGPVSLPAGLRGLVTGVVGLDTRSIAATPSLTRSSTLVSPRARAAQASVPPTSAYLCSQSPSLCQGQRSGCAPALATGGFTPDEYLTAYGYNALQSQGTLGQGERVALIEIDGFKAGDIDAFASCFGLQVPTIQPFGVGGVGKPLAAGGETTLDLEVLDAAAPKLKQIDVYEAPSDTSDALMAFTAPLQNPGYKPEIISASLGLCEVATYETAGRSAINATESALQEAAASGITFLAASGDDGSADCMDPSTGSPEGRLAVNYPASSPWVTGVGGTNFLLNSSNQITDQVVWNDGAAEPGAAGGGGFSNLFAKPGYQDGVVSGRYRAVPDVSMLADIAPGYAIYCTAPGASACGGAGWQTVGGTSAATPLLAGGFALVDQLLLAGRQQPLGLANQLLYKLGDAQTTTSTNPVFDEITQGSNDIGGTGGQIDFAPLGCCTAGPNAGYNEAAGWGSVNLANLVPQALATQPKIVNIAMSLPGGQHPVRAKHIVAKVSCSGECLMGAVAEVKIGNARPFAVYSSEYQLGAAGSRAVTIGFSSSQLKKLRTAVSHHKRVLAAVVGAIIDPAGDIERASGARTLKITS